MKIICVLVAFFTGSLLVCSIKNVCMGRECAAHVRATQAIEENMSLFDQSMVPGHLDKVLEELNRQATQLIWTMNASVDNAFADFDRQRGELQQYVTREREALVEQLRATGDELVRTTLDAVPGLVGKILLYVVLALAVLIGGPFALGFWLGGVRAKARIKNEKLKMKN